MASFFGLMHGDESARREQVHGLEEDLRMLEAQAAARDSGDRISQKDRDAVTWRRYWASLMLHAIDHPAAGTTQIPGPDGARLMAARAVLSSPTTADYLSKLPPDQQFVRRVLGAKDAVENVALEMDWLLTEIGRGMPTVPQDDPTLAALNIDAQALRARMEIPEPAGEGFGELARSHFRLMRGEAYTGQYGVQETLRGLFYINQIALQGSLGQSA